MQVVIFGIDRNAAVMDIPICAFYFPTLVLSPPLVQQLAPAVLLLQYCRHAEQLKCGAFYFKEGRNPLCELRKSLHDEQ